MSAITLSLYDPSNWFTRAGIARKWKLFLSNDPPDVYNWRFITLTINRDLFSSPLEAYLHVLKNRCIKRFITHLRSMTSDTVRYCWKLEFQGDGWPHWHFIVELKRKLTRDEMRALDDVWGLGQTNTKRAKDCRYLFKYLFKSDNPETEYDDDSDTPTLLVPDWFADYRSPTGETFFRARMFQTSKGFFGKRQRSRDTRNRKPKKTSLVRYTVRERHKYFTSRMALLLSPARRYPIARIILAAPFITFQGTLLSLFNAGVLALGWHCGHLTYTSAYLTPLINGT